jgi:hypothetical protein
MHKGMRRPSPAKPTKQGKQSSEKRVWKAEDTENGWNSNFTDLNQYKLSETELVGHFD